MRTRVVASSVSELQSNPGIDVVAVGSEVVGVVGGAWLDVVVGGGNVVTTEVVADGGPVGTVVSPPPATEHAGASSMANSITAARLMA